MYTHVCEQNAQTHTHTDKHMHTHMYMYIYIQIGKSALDLAIKLGNQIGARYIIANDPDADRAAIAQKIDMKDDSSWYIYNGNQIASLLAIWCLFRYKQKHNKQHKDDLGKVAMVASTVSSKALKKMAQIEGK